MHPYFKCGAGGYQLTFHNAKVERNYENIRIGPRGDHIFYKHLIMKHLARGEIPLELIRKLMGNAIGKLNRALCEHVFNNGFSGRVIEKALGKGSGFIKRVLDGEMLCDVSVGKLSDVYTDNVYDIMRNLDMLQRNENKEITVRERQRQTTYLKHELDSLVDPLFNIFDTFIHCFAKSDYLRGKMLAKLKEMTAFIEEMENTKK